MTNVLFSTLLAEHGHGHGWWVVFPLLWLALIAAVIWFGFRRWGRPRGDRHGRAREILAERFASGELTGDEYRERLAQLG